MAEIFQEENAIILAAAEKMVALGSEAAQRSILGKESKTQEAKGEKILRLLTAYRKKDDLTDAQLESILYCLRQASESNVFPTIDPIVGQNLEYLVQEEGDGSSALIMQNAGSDLPSRSYLNFYRGLTASDDGTRTNVGLTLGTDGYVLTMDSGLPVWLPASGGGHVIFNGVDVSGLADRDNLRFSNGLTASDNDPYTDVKWGGAITANTIISGAFTIDYTNTLTRFVSGGFGIRNPANTFDYKFVGGAILADRNITLPLLGGNDVMVTEAFAQALTNKTGLISQWTNDSGYLTSLSGAWLAASGVTFTGNNTITGTGFTLKGVWTGLGVTQTDGYGLWLANTTAAAAGAQQKSPSLVLEGQGWKTDATAGSQSVKFSIDVLPTQGTANPTGGLYIRSSINGAAYTSGNGVVLIGHDGQVSIASNLTISGGRLILFNGGTGTIGVDVNSQLLMRANGGATVQSTGYYRFYNVNTAYTPTSGAAVIMGLEIPFAPTSGTATLTGLNVSGTINQTGGANGQITIVGLNPTFTAAVSVIGYDFNPVNPGNVSSSLIAYRSTAGNLVFGGATISTSGVFSWNNTTKEVKVNGARIWTDHDTNGKDNHFFGYNSGNTSVTGIDNLGFGPGTLLAITTGDGNFCGGNLAGSSITDGDYNIIIGFLAGTSVTTTSYNIILGGSAGVSTTGSANIIIGGAAGDALTSGSYNIVLGYDVDVQTNTADGQLTIQNAILGDGNATPGKTLSDGIVALYHTGSKGSWQRALFVGSRGAVGSAITDGSVLYVQDITAGNAAPHFMTENGDIIKLYKNAAITTALTTITHTAPGTPDYALATVQLAGYGFSTQDEGNTVLSVIANLQTRVNELEDILQNLGVAT